MHIVVIVSLIYGR